MNRSFGRRTSFALLAVILLVCPPGCKDDPKSEASEAGVAGGLAKIAPKPRGTTKVPLASPVMAVVGIPSLEKVLGDGARLANTVAPGQVPPAMASMVLESLKDEFGLTDIGWLDQKAPIRMAVVRGGDGPGQEDGALVLPVTDMDKVMASLKPTAKKGEGGHLASYEHRLESYFLDGAKGHVVITNKPDVYGKVKSFIDETLLQWKPAHGLSVQIDMGQLNTRYANEISQARALVSQLAKQAAAEETLVKAGKIQELQVGLLFGLIESSEWLEIYADSEGTGLEVGMAIEGREGTTLAKFANTLSGKTCGLVEAASPQTWFGVAGNMDVRGIESLRQIQTASIAAYADVLKLSPADQKKLTGLFDKLAALSTGESLTSVHLDGSFPMAIDGLMTVTDASQARSAYEEIVGLVFEKGWALVEAELKKGSEIKLPPVKITTVGQLIGVVSPFTAAFGIGLEVVHRGPEGGLAGGGSHVDGLVITIDWDTLAKQSGASPGDAANIAMAQQVVGKRIEMGMSFDDKRGRIGFGFGPHGLTRAAELAAGKMPGGDRLLTAASAGHAMAMTIRPAMLLQALTFLPDLADKKAAFARIPSDRAITMRGKASGRTMEFTLAVPMDLVGALATLD